MQTERQLQWLWRRRYALALSNVCFVAVSCTSWKSCDAFVPPSTLRAAVEASSVRKAPPLDGDTIGNLASVVLLATPRGGKEVTEDNDENGKKLPKGIIQRRRRPSSSNNGVATNTIGGSSSSSRRRLDTPTVKNGLRVPSDSRSKKRGVSSGDSSGRSELNISDPWLADGVAISATKDTEQRRKRKVAATPTQGFNLSGSKILTREQEQRLARSVRKAAQMKQRVDELIERRELERCEDLERQRHHQQRMLEDDSDFESGLLEEELEEFLIQNRRMTRFEDLEGYSLREEFVECDDDEELLGLSVYGINSRVGTMEEYESKNILNNFDKSGRYGFDSSDPSADINRLTEHDIIETLGIPGGRAELSRILIAGAMARQQMIWSNIRLVMGISRRWFRFSSRNAGNSESHDKRIYQGSWNTPSLDEVIQEGILGLAKATERFEPERNLKFSTYATYYITNEVRGCFQRTSTGCLRVPTNYFGLRARYQKLVAAHYMQTGDALALEVAAKEMGLKPDRLRFILKSTEPLVQLDAPAQGSQSGAAKAGESAAGTQPDSMADYLER